ncbi:MAG: SPOR domain-containing protein [Kineosporiaceae bacterium]
MAEYYFNLRTREVEEGRQSPWTDLMGPYPTREAAAAALETAQERTEAEDTRDAEWRDWGVPPAAGRDQS